MLIMRKLFNIAALAAGIALMTVSCAREEAPDTNVFPQTSEVVLTAYGPRPVARGGVLRFVGSNLDQVASVTIPGCSPITEIEVVKAGNPSEIHVTVPKEEPVEGTVTLTTKGGKVIETDTPLTYIETIVLESVVPAEAYPGEQVTISGDYLNLIHEVTFTKDVVVSEKAFVSQDRYKIVVKVPAEASTGKIGIGTIDESVVTDEDILASLNVIEEDFTVKTAQGSVSGSYRPGAEVTVTGTKLSLVTEVKVGMTSIPVASKTDSKLTFVLPEDVQPGDVLLVHASGVEVEAGAIEIVSPAVTAADPSPVRPGETLTLTGTDLDLVSSLEVPAVSDENRWPAFENTATSLKFTVPADATAEDLVLHMKNGQSVAVPYSLLVPTIESLTPNPVAAGEKLTVKGTGLELVTGVTLGGQEEEFEVVSDTELAVLVRPASLSGELVLITASGAKVAAEEEVSIDYGSKVQVTSLTAEGKPGDEITMTGSGFNWIESIYLGDVKVVAYTKRSDEQICFLLPDELQQGTYPLTINLTSGEQESPVGWSITYSDEAAPTFLTIWEGSVLIDWNNPPAPGTSGSMSDLSWGGYDWESVYPGTTVNIYYNIGTLGEYAQMRFANGSWSALPGTPDYYDIYGSTCQSIELTSDMLDALRSQGGLVLTGFNYEVTKVELVIPPAGTLEPVKDTDILLVDWDDHGGHNGYWDQPDGWGGVTTELVWKAEGDLYLRITGGSEDQKWVVCCNHQANYTDNVPAWSIDDLSKYVLKIDVLLEGEGAQNMTFNPVLGDNWPGGREAGLFPATTGGEWITVTIDLGLSGSLDCSSGTNGFMAAGVPAGMCLDNYRLSLR